MAMDKLTFFLIPLLLPLLLTSPSLALEKITSISGVNVVSQEAHSLTTDKARKGTVIIFLSAKCPCSASHENLLKELSLTYKDFQFVGIHSNADEDASITKDHFAVSALPFPVIQDEASNWANKLGALKTPHAYVLDTQGNLIYQGGVTDSHIGPTAKKQYLKEVLEDLDAGKKSRHHEGRALGCYIARVEEE